MVIRHDDVAADDVADDMGESEAVMWTNHGLPHGIPNEAKIFVKLQN